jgi:hypothetical protein
VVKGTESTTVLAGLQPAALWAAMRKEYLVPLVNPLAV